MMKPNGTMAAGRRDGLKQEKLRKQNGKYFEIYFIRRINGRQE